MVNHFSETFCKYFILGDDLRRMVQFTCYIPNFSSSTYLSSHVDVQWPLTESSRIIYTIPCKGSFIRE
jgi:hypothetical protein